MSKLTGTCNVSFEPLSLTETINKACLMSSCEATNFQVGAKQEPTEKLEF